MTRRKVYYIPGLGADFSMFSLLVERFPGSPIKWPNHLGSDLKTLAQKIIETNTIQDSDIVIGFSFGGQIAKEIKSLKPGVFSVAIASVRHSKELTLQFKKSTQLLGLIPDFLLKNVLLDAGIKHATKNTPGISKEHKSMLADMVKDLDLEFFRKTVKLCAEWDNNETMDVYHIHGSLDTVIPYERESVDALINGAGHLLTFTHPDEIHQQIESYLVSKTPS